MVCGVGVGYTQRNPAIRSLGFASIFDAEVFTILETCWWVGHGLSPKRNTVILTDKRAAIKDLYSMMTSSRLAGSAFLGSLRRSGCRDSHAGCCSWNFRGGHHRSGIYLHYLAAADLRWQRQITFPKSRSEPIAIIFVPNACKRIQNNAVCTGHRLIGYHAGRLGISCNKQHRSYGNLLPSDTCFVIVEL